MFIVGKRKHKPLSCCLFSIIVSTVTLSNSKDSQRMLKIENRGCHGNESGKIEKKYLHFCSSLDRRKIKMDKLSRKSIFFFFFQRILMLSDYAY